MIKRLFAVLFALIAATAFAAADVNKASQAELEAIKGIGPSIAGKILDERKKSNFKDWPDLVERVKGVGDANAAKFSTAGLTVNGQGFAGAAAPAAKPVKAEKSADKAAATTAAAPAAKADKVAAKTEAAPAPMSKADAKAAAKAKKDEEAAAKAKAAADDKAAKVKAKADAKAAKAEAKAAKADAAASAVKK